MSTCNKQYPCVGPIKLLCTINRTLNDILNLLRSTITHTHDLMLYYNGKWKIPRQGDFLGYFFTETNPIKFEIPSRCSIKKLKDVIKQVALIGIPLHGIHESQLVRQLFFRQLNYIKYSEKLIKYQIIELKTNEDLLKVLTKSNYWNYFCPIEILVISNKPTIQL